jgi:hypothetical protein
MTATTVAHDVMVKAAKALACTAIDLIMKPELLEATRMEYSLRRADQAKQLQQ